MSTVARSDAASRGASASIQVSVAEVERVAAEFTAQHADALTSAYASTTGVGSCLDGRSPKVQSVSVVQVAAEEVRLSVRVGTWNSFKNEFMAHPAPIDYPVRVVGDKLVELVSKARQAPAPKDDGVFTIGQAAGSAAPDNVDRMDRTRNGDLLLVDYCERPG
jgi:hypothetical protein